MLCCVHMVFDCLETNKRNNTKIFSMIEFKIGLSEFKSKLTLCWWRLWSSSSRHFNFILQKNVQGLHGLWRPDWPDGWHPESKGQDTRYESWGKFGCTCLFWFHKTNLFIVLLDCRYFKGCKGGGEGAQEGHGQNVWEDANAATAAGYEC